MSTSTILSPGDELLEFGEARMEAIEGRFGIFGKLSGELRISLEDVNVESVVGEEGGEASSSNRAA
jgi:hypothetical protein